MSPPGGSFPTCWRAPRDEPRRRSRSNAAVLDLREPWQSYALPCATSGSWFLSRGADRRTLVTLSVCLIGGPTAVIEYAGVRWLTDPTFSPPGEYAGGLVKTTGPAV